MSPTGDQFRACGGVKECFSTVSHEMETTNATIPDIRIAETMREGLSAAEATTIKCRVDEISREVDELEQKLNEVEQFYLTTNKKQLNKSKGSSILREKDRDKQIASFKKRQQDASRREAAAAKRMQELMRQFGTILRQITQLKWAEPFMEPVDVVGLKLHDYYEVIEKPMDFSTIKNKMDAKDGTGYKNVREICADVRLIFKNAMKYNDERNDVHVMAKSLLAKFEEKWLILLPKVDDEEKQRKEEESEALLDMQLVQEAAHGKLAKDLNLKFDEVDMHLEDLREIVLQKCRRVSTEEKRCLMTALTKLSTDDLNKALLLIAQDNPNFKATAEEVDLDMDALTNSTLWKLKLFVKDTLQAQGTNPVDRDVHDDHHTANATTNNNNKRKREICDALAKTAQKKNKKLPQ